MSEAPDHTEVGFIGGIIGRMAIISASSAGIPPSASMAA
jgi:hypothetical protein